MDLAEFDVLAVPLQRKSAESVARYGFALIEGRTSTPDEITHVEDRMGVIFPDKYKVFTTRYGGGAFGFVELLPLVEPEKPDKYGDVWTENDRYFPDHDFVAVAEVGTGDYWVFPVADGRCHEQVWFHFLDADDHERVAADFLEFVPEYGLKKFQRSSTGMPQSVNAAHTPPSTRQTVPRCPSVDESLVVLDDLSVQCHDMQLDEVGRFWLAGHDRGILAGKQQ